jgi:hypothetical protein
MLEVVAVGQTTINGITLQQLSVVTIHEEGWGITPQFQIIERIGMTPCTPHLFGCVGAIDYYFPHFSCCSDHEMQGPEQADRFLTLGNADLGAVRSAITLHPNPGTTAFQLTGLGAQVAQLRLLDMQGRVVLGANSVMDQRPVNTTGIPAGVYLVELTTAKGPQVLRWVKE